MEEKSSYFPIAIIAIVAVVAVVGLIGLFSNKGSRNFLTNPSGQNIAGLSYSDQCKGTCESLSESVNSCICADGRGGDICEWDWDFGCQWCHHWGSQVGKEMPYECDHASEDKECKDGDSCYFN